MLPKFPILIYFVVCITFCFVACTTTNDLPSPTITLSKQIVDRVSTTTPTTEFERSTSIPTPTLLEEVDITLTPTQSSPLIQLTFVSQNAGKYGVYAIEVGCINQDLPCFGEPELLFERFEKISQIDWSPYGSRIVFESEGNIYIANWNGLSVFQIPNKPGRGTWPQWSRDGTKIVYIFLSQRSNSDTLNPPQIKMYDTKTEQISTLLGDVLDPSKIYWLPNDTLAYITRISETDWTEVIKISNIDGSLTDQIAENATNFSQIFGFDVSPDGRRFVLSGETIPNDNKTTRDIYIYTLESKEVVNLTNGLGNNYGPTWLPLNDWIAFESNRTDNYNIYVIKPDGSSLLQVTDIQSDSGYPAWRIIER
jgi:Tol biopolymer transport system component